MAKTLPGLKRRAPGAAPSKSAGTEAKTEAAEAPKSDNPGKTGLDSKSTQTKARTAAGAGPRVGSRAASATARARAKPKAETKPKPEPKPAPKPKPHMGKPHMAKPHMEREAAAKGDNGRAIRADVLSPSGETEGGRRARLGQARAVVARKANWATLGGVVPIPFLDIATISGVQLSMLADLSEIYDRPFDDNAARAIVSSLLGGTLPHMAGVGLGGYIAKAMPLLGTGVGVVTVCVLGRAFTKALGRLFIIHFESGGAVLDFDPEAMRAHFRVEFERAKGGK